MPITPITGVAKANDKYRAQLRATWISDPADTSLLVTAVPDNVPTIVVTGWNTELETIFSVTGKSGDSSANYALTGVVRLRGANVNLAENTTVNCLNNEEFFNQYESKINDVIDEVNDALEVVDGLSSLVGVSALTDGATPALDASLGSVFTLSAEGNRTIGIPTNPVDGKKIIIVHHASGGARTLALNSGTGGFAFGTTVASLSETASGKRDLIGAIYNITMDKWLVVAVVKGY